MSKTAGNVIDPIKVMDEYGTDALRFSLLTGSTPGNDMNLAMERIEANRNFANKIWNAARFLVSNLNGEEPTGVPPLEGLSIPDRWILSRLHRLIETVNRLFDAYLYGEAGRQVYDFLWGEYADWYIEISKIALYGDDRTAKSRTRRVLVYVLDQCLRLLHPFVPYVTEEIWQHIPHEGETLIIAQWPEEDGRFFDDEAEAALEMLQALVRGIRNVRAEYKVEPAKRIRALIVGGEQTPLLEEHRDLFARLANVDAGELHISASVEQPPEQAASVTIGGVTVFLPLAGLVDLDAERERLREELDGTAQQISRTETLLANGGFTAKAPAEVIRREQDKLADLQAQHNALRERLEKLG
jgi:valyl-tRNA synthetase